MAAALDRTAFYASLRLNPFPGFLTPAQVSGMEALLDASPPDMPLEHLAYCLGTCPIETAWTRLPIKEKGGSAYLARMYDINGDRPAKARELGNLKPGDGALFCGRGYVQLTGRSNYRRATGRLRSLGYLLAGQDLEATPDHAMHPDVASAILYVGQREGWPVHGTVEQPGCGDAAGAQTRRDGGGFPVALGHAHPTAFAARSAPVAAGHGRVGRGLVDEHETIRIEVELTLEPRLACGLHVLPVLLGRVTRAFFREMPWRLKKRERLLWATPTPCSARAARSSWR
jgi:putative chitinase